LICGIIDMGSNTIRLSIYKYENDTVRLLLNKKTMAGLLGYVSGGVMTPKGIDKACCVLEEYKSILSNFNIEEAYVFATASLRNITNSAEVIEAIKERTGLETDLISGEEEARLDFSGAVRASGLSKGLVVDIGGGSTEIVSFRDRKVVKAVSIPLGSLNLFLKHVPLLLPTSDNIKEIKKNVSAELKKLDVFEDRKLDIICGVGGTVRAAGKLYNDIYGQRHDNDELDAGRLARLLQLYKGDKKTALNKILQISPERVHTVIPGMVLLNAIAKESRSKKIIVSQFGVREGYLYDRVLKL